MKQLFKDFDQRAAEWRAANSKSDEAIPSLDDLYTREEQQERILASGVLESSEPADAAGIPVSDLEAQAARIDDSLLQFQQEAIAALQTLCALGRTRNVRVAVLVEAGDEVVGSRRYLSFDLDSKVARTPLLLALASHAMASADDPGMVAVAEVIGMLAKANAPAQAERSSPTGRGQS